MARRATNYHYNYPRVIQYLRDNDIEYFEFNDGQHLRIMGPVAMVDLWPSRMTVHVVVTEGVDPNRYFQLDWNFNPEQLEDVLEGRDWRKS